MTEEDKPLTIVMAAPEAFPYSKTGGLGDVTGALPQALAALGHDVHLFTPLYRGVDRKKWQIPDKGEQIEVAISSRIIEATILTIERELVSVHFVDCPAYFDRDGIYQTESGVDHADNLERFSFFSKSVIEGALKLSLKPDIIHCHDWQTGLIPPLLRNVYREKDHIGDATAVLTIHNLSYQGIFPSRGWHLTGLAWSLFQHEFLEFHSQINLLKGAISFADLITTVSPTYAREIRDKEYGFGLEGMLESRHESLFGVLNGIDTKEWNPATDHRLPANYSVDDMSGKKICKEKLMAKLGLRDSDGPLIGVVSRLVEQKGLHLFAEVAEKILAKGARLALIGTGDAKIEEAFRQIAKNHPKRATCIIGYDDRIAHQIEAGADLFMMPSVFEPCGLNQMYSLAYGTPPLVRATGGLADTVYPFDRATGKGNGFTFTAPTSGALLTAAESAMALYSEEKGAWDIMVKNGMSEDHSWSGSATEYERLYRLAISWRK